MDRLNAIIRKKFFTILIIIFLHLIMAKPVETRDQNAAQVRLAKSLNHLTKPQATIGIVQAGVASDFPRRRTYTFTTLLYKIHQQRRFCFLHPQRQFKNQTLAYNTSIQCLFLLQLLEYTHILFFPSAYSVCSIKTQQLYQQFYSQQ